MDTNITIFSGRLTRDPEYNFTKGGIQRMNGGLACNQYKDKVLFVNFTMYGERCDKLRPYLHKGKEILISGPLEEYDYTDKNGVKKKYSYVKVADLSMFGKAEKGTVGKSEQERIAEEIAKPLTNNKPINPEDQSVDDFDFPADAFAE